MLINPSIAVTPLLDEIYFYQSELRLRLAKTYLENVTCLVLDRISDRTYELRLACNFPFNILAAFEFIPLKTSAGIASRYVKLPRVLSSTKEDAILVHKAQHQLLGAVDTIDKTGPFSFIGGDSRMILAISYLRNALLALHAPKWQTDPEKSDPPSVSQLAKLYQLALRHSLKATRSFEGLLKNEPRRTGGNGDYSNEYLVTISHLLCALLRSFVVVDCCHTLGSFILPKKSDPLSGTNNMGKPKELLMSLARVSTFILPHTPSTSEANYNNKWLVQALLLKDPNLVPLWRWTEENVIFIALKTMMEEAPRSASMPCWRLAFSTFLSLRRLGHSGISVRKLRAVASLYLAEEH